MPVKRRGIVRIGFDGSGEVFERNDFVVIPDQRLDEANCVEPFPFGAFDGTVVEVVPVEINVCAFHGDAFILQGPQPKVKAPHRLDRVWRLDGRFISNFGAACKGAQSSKCDQALWTVTTDDAAPWVVVTDESKDGVSSVRSGAIGNDEETSLTTTVDGSGTLSFWWKVSCEDDPDNDNWDFLAVSVDGAEVARIDGETDWRMVTIAVKGDGTHAVTWVYSKDYMDDEWLDVEDCGWVDQVSWSATVGASSVPTAWLESLGLAKGGESAAAVANQDPDGDGFTTEEEYVIGTDPTDPKSKFTASIEMVDGKPVVTCEPNLLNERKYTRWGKKDLSNPDEKWQRVDDGQEVDYNFFTVTVELPK